MPLLLAPSRGAKILSYSMWSLVTNGGKTLTAVLVTEVSAVVLVVAGELFPDAELVGALVLSFEASVEVQVCGGDGVVLDTHTRNRDEETTDNHVLHEIYVKKNNTKAMGLKFNGETRAWITGKYFAS